MGRPLGRRDVLPDRDAASTWPEPASLTELVSERLPQRRSPGRHRERPALEPDGSPPLSPVVAEFLAAESRLLVKPTPDANSSPQLPAPPLRAHPRLRRIVTRHFDLVVTALIFLAMAAFRSDRSTSQITTGLAM